MTENKQEPVIDHLFRHQYGKMVAILSKIFGPSHLEHIEDAIQDTFIQASLKWRTEIPENPEAWLTQAAKNRTIDLFRQISAQKERKNKMIHGSATLKINDFFLDHEVADSQLRMIFLACHPSFKKEEQIVFALKCISGFSLREIAAALLQKEETIKKRIARTRKKIKEKKLHLDYPSPTEIHHRLSGVLQIIYLIFNEGFHSTKEHALVDRDLCGEALRLCRHLLQKKTLRSGSVYALFALLCFHASRLEAKTAGKKVIDLRHQDRTQWYQPLINLGHEAFEKAFQFPDQSIYHLEAAIAREHIMAESFEKTNWSNILTLYEEMYTLMPTTSVLLSLVAVHVQMHQLEAAEDILQKIDAEKLEKRKYLYHASYFEVYQKQKRHKEALHEIEKAIALCPNQMEKDHLKMKRDQVVGSS